MNKNLFFALFASLVLFVSCTPGSSIEYNKITGVELGNLKKEHAKFSALVLFNNISEDQFAVRNMVLDLKIDGKDIGTIVIKQPKEVRPHSEFSVPVNYVYETTTILAAGEEPADVYLIQLSGDLTLKDKNGNEVTVPVKYKEPYAYLSKKEERIEKRKERKADKQDTMDGLN